MVFFRHRQSQLFVSAELKPLRMSQHLLYSLLGTRGRTELSAPSGMPSDDRGVHHMYLSPTVSQLY